MVYWRGGTSGGKCSFFGNSFFAANFRDSNGIQLFQGFLWSDPDHHSIGHLSTFWGDYPALKQRLTDLCVQLACGLQDRGQDPLSLDCQLWLVNHWASWAIIQFEILQDPARRTAFRHLRGHSPGGRCRSLQHFDPWFWFDRATALGVLSGLAYEWTSFTRRIPAWSCQLDRRRGQSPAAVWFPSRW